jgi:hypothetical protein
LLRWWLIAEPDQPKRVLMLHSFEPDFGDEFARPLHAELDKRLPGRLDLYENWLVSERFAGRGEDAAFAQYLGNLSRRKLQHFFDVAGNKPISGVVRGHSGGSVTRESPGCAVPQNLSESIQLGAGDPQ